MPTDGTYTRADVESLARKLYAFREQLGPSEQRCLDSLLRYAARNRPDVAGYDGTDHVTAALGPWQTWFESLFAPYIARG